MHYLCAQILVLILILFEMANNNKIEKASLIAIEKYLLSCSLIESFISANDKTPFWDGALYVYKDEQKGNKKDNFHGRVPVQVKGRSDNSTNFTISSAEAKAYMNDGGCLYFKVLVKEDFSTTILYSLLSRSVIKENLQQSSGDIKFQLDKVPNNPFEFQQKVYDFVTSRNKEKNENTTPKEIADLVEGMEKISRLLNEIEDKEAKIKLKSFLDTIKNLTDDDSSEIETIGWRDTFIVCSKEALDLAINNLKDHDFAELQFQLGAYLHNQKQYHLVEGYYQMSLEEFRKRDDIVSVAMVLNYLASLHDDLNRKDEAEQEYQKALEIRRELAESNRDAYIVYVAETLNNLAILHDGLTHYDVAEREYLEALKIYRELAKNNRNACVGDVAKTLNNLAILHKNLIRYDEAEREYQEALKIYRELAKNNRIAYIGDVAMTLSNLGNLHRIRSQNRVAEREYQEALEIRRELAKTNRNVYTEDVATNLNNLAILHYYDSARYKEAEKEYQEALEIRRELAKSNRDVYIGYVAQTLNNLANLHKKLARFEEAEKEYREAIEIRRELARKYPDAFIGDLARTLENLAVLLRKVENRMVEARDAANEALGIYKELAKKYPQIWNRFVKKTQRLLGKLNGVEKKM